MFLLGNSRKQHVVGFFCWDADHVCWCLVVWCVLWVYMFVFSINFFHTVRFSSISSRNDSSSLHKSYVWMYLHSHVMIDIPAFGTVMALGHLVTVSSTSFEMKMKIWMDFLDPSVQSEGDFLQVTICFGNQSKFCSFSVYSHVCSYVHTNTYKTKSLNASIHSFITVTSLHTKVVGIYVGSY